MTAARLPHADAQHIQDVMIHAWAGSTRKAYGSGILAFHVYCDSKAIEDNLILQKLDPNIPLDAAVGSCLTTAFYSIVCSNIHKETDHSGLTTIVFCLPHTKTSQTGEDVFWAQQDGPTDPEAALANYFHINDPPPDSALFSYKFSGTHRPLMKLKFITWLALAAKSTGLDPLQGHAIRIGVTPFNVILESMLKFWHHTCKQLLRFKTSFCATQCPTFDKQTFLCYGCSWFTRCIIGLLQLWESQLTFFLQDMQLGTRRCYPEFWEELTASCEHALALAAKQVALSEDDPVMQDINNDSSLSCGALVVELLNPRARKGHEIGSTEDGSPIACGEVETMEFEGGEEVGLAVKEALGHGKRKQKANTLYSCLFWQHHDS
ncbi:hypothetical protein BDR06DRAFT_971297 [Suillus hirtellus]|nr:hypothetical protein BDR06DRAFT_971297 [Suillus hirtellus]